MIDNLFTLTGIPVEQISARLAEPFDDPKAYKPVPGGADLTDINTGHMLERVNQVFGPKGLGWNLLFSKDDVEVIGDPATAKRIMVRLTYARFQYTLVDGQGERQVYEIPTGGVNTNEFTYAEEGARTSALGAALKGLGFQLPVYKGLLDHHNAGRLIGGDGKGASPTGGIHAPTRPGNGRNGGQSAKGTPEASNPPEIEDLDGPTPQATGDPGAFEIPVGRYGPQNGQPGMKLAEAPLPWIQWAANQMQPSSDKTRALQAAAKAFLARQPA
jgi:hypothetical protein